MCPLGTGTALPWERLIKGQSGVVALDSPEYKTVPCKVAALVPRGNEKGQFKERKKQLQKIISIDRRLLHGTWEKHEAFTECFSQVL